VRRKLVIAATGREVYLSLQNLERLPEDTEAGVSDVSSMLLLRRWLIELTMLRKLRTDLTTARLSRRDVNSRGYIVLLHDSACCVSS
jgi:hypothetical protein